jgi:tRNA 5-methylaminomethyl-2-thiouridine biosynthesis bifunctional protein
LHNPSLTLCPDEQRDNRLRLARHFPSLAQALDLDMDDSTARGRVARRCTTPDYLPIVGPAPNFKAYLEQFSFLRKNARASVPHAGPNWPNLYINIGYGSRGLTYTPLCAELLAAQLDRTPLPVSRNLQIALHPARFIIRGLIRKKL